jgi:hypothetical protein
MQPRIVDLLLLKSREMFAIFFLIYFVFFNQKLEIFVWSDLLVLWGKVIGVFNILLLEIRRNVFNTVAKKWYFDISLNGGEGARQPLVSDHDLKFKFNWLEILKLVLDQ